MVYLRLYETTQEFENDYLGENYEEPWVSYTENSETVNYNRDIEPALKDIAL